MKKVGKYVILTLLMLLGLCCVGLLYLFFVPDSTLFNITYINLNKRQSTEKILTNNIEAVELNSRSYDVLVVPSKDDTISLEVKSSSFGFVLTKNKQTKVTYTVEHNVLIFNVYEPHGFAIKNDSYIKLHLPEKTYEDKYFDLKLTNKNAQTEIVDKKIKVQDFTYSTNDGDAFLKNMSVLGDINLNINKSKFKMDSSVVTKSETASDSNNVNLRLTSGKFYAKGLVLRNININKNKRGSITLGTCADIIETQLSAGGQISAKEVTSITVNASDTIININKAGNAQIDLSGGGRVKIKELLNDSRITTNSGSIIVSQFSSKLGTSKLEPSKLTAYSDEGNITIKKAYGTISTKTILGDINIAFAEDEDSFSSSTQNSSRTLYAIIHNGKLTAKGVEHTGFRTGEVTKNSEATNGIVVTGKGRIYLEMNDVCGDNNVIGKDGNVKIIINHSSNYKLTTNPTTSTKGKVRVNLLQIVDYLGYRTKSAVTTYVNCNQSSFSDSLTASTKTGDLIILDTQLC